MSKVYGRVGHICAESPVAQEAAALDLNQVHIPVLLTDLTTHHNCLCNGGMQNVNGVPRDKNQNFVSVCIASHDTEVKNVKPYQAGGASMDSMAMSSGPSRNISGIPSAGSF
jgi:hypothetical protein